MSTRHVAHLRHRWSQHHDRGSVLLMTMLFAVMLGLMVVALLTWVSTVMRVRPPLEERTSVSESVRSGIRMGINQQRVHGPDECFDDSQTTYTNGYTVTITCVTDGAPDYDNPNMRGRFGVITTSHSPTEPGLYGVGVGVAKELSGEVLVNGGQYENTSADIAVTDPLWGSLNPYPGGTGNLAYQDGIGADVDCTVASVTAYGGGMTCLTDPWTARAGFNPLGAGWIYPDLPPIPSQGRGPTQILDIGGGCTVYFPGRYTAPLTISSGRHFFASGVYLFEAPLTVNGTADAVFGEGRFEGCALDATAALYQSSGPPVVAAPKNHSITGKGATLLLAGSATLTVDNASLQINRRLSTPQTRATEGVAVRIVQTSALDTAELSVPADQVMLDPGDDVTAPTREPAATHSISGTAYSSSTIGWNDVIVDVDFRGGAATNNVFVADGAIFAPTARVRVQADDSAYVLKASGGVVGSRVGLEMTALPASASENYVFGARTGIVQNKFRLVASIVSGSIRSNSTAELQLHQNGSYGVNNWTLDLDGGGGPTGTTTTTTTLPVGPTTTTTLPVGPTTTTTVPVGPTTTTTVPVGPAPPIPVDYCDVGSEFSYTFDFGPGDWSGDYYDNRYLNEPAVATSVVDNEVRFDWGTGSPVPLTVADNFSVRWTRTINVLNTCTMQFRAGGDDGFRLYLDGIRVIDRWTAQSFTQRSTVRTLTAGEHTIVMEFYEQGGNAQAWLRWRID